MTRLNKYIAEEKDQNWYLDKFVPLIQKECKPFLRDIKGAKGTLVRIDKKNNPIHKRKVRTDRRPLDTNKEFHDYIDDYFFKTFGWRGRSNVLFTWGRKFGVIGLYDWIVFPIGNYKIIWSDTLYDLYSESPTVKEFEDELAKTYTDKDIKTAVTFDHEVMLNCKEVYMARGYLASNINERLNLSWQGLRRK